MLTEFLILSDQIERLTPQRVVRMSHTETYWLTVSPKCNCWSTPWRRWAGKNTPYADSSLAHSRRPGTRSNPSSPRMGNERIASTSSIKWPALPPARLRPRRAFLLLGAGSGAVGKHYQPLPPREREPDVAGCRLVWEPSLVVSEPDAFL